MHLKVNHVTETLRYVTGGFEAVYGHEAEWAEVMFGEWGADGYVRLAWALGYLKLSTAVGPENINESHILAAYASCMLYQYHISTDTLDTHCFQGEGGPHVPGRVLRERAAGAHDGGRVPAAHHRTVGRRDRGGE